MSQLGHTLLQASVRLSSFFRSTPAPVHHVVLHAALDPPVVGEGRTAVGHEGPWRELARTPEAGGARAIRELLGRMGVAAIGRHRVGGVRAARERDSDQDGEEAAAEKEPPDYRWS